MFLLLDHTFSGPFQRLKWLAEFVVALLSGGKKLKFELTEHAQCEL